MADDEKKLAPTQVKLDPKIHRKGKIDAAKNDKTIAETYAEIITNYYKGRR